MSLRRVEEAAGAVADTLSRLTRRRAPADPNRSFAEQLLDDVRRDQVPELLDALREKL